MLLNPNHKWASCSSSLLCCCVVIVVAVVVAVSHEHRLATQLSPSWSAWQPRCACLVGTLHAGRRCCDPQFQRVPYTKFASLNAWLWIAQTPCGSIIYLASTLSWTSYTSPCKAPKAWLERNTLQVLLLILECPSVLHRTPFSPSRLVDYSQGLYFSD